MKTGLLIFSLILVRATGEMAGIIFDENIRSPVTATPDKPWQSEVFARSAPNLERNIPRFFRPAVPQESHAPGSACRPGPQPSVLPNRTSQPVDRLMVKGRTLYVLLL